MAVPPAFVYEGIQHLNGDKWHRCLIHGVLFFVKRLEIEGGKIVAASRLCDPDRPFPKGSLAHEVRACSSLHNAVWLSAAVYNDLVLCHHLVTMDCDQLWKDHVPREDW